jgi:hypothetical protein
LRSPLNSISLGTRMASSDRTLSLREQALLAVRWSVPFWLFAAVGLPFVAQSHVHRYFFFTLLWGLVLLPGSLLGLVVLGGIQNPPWYLVLAVYCLGQYLGIYAFIRVRFWVHARLAAKHARHAITGL